MQEHANDGTNSLNLFSYGTVLMGNLDVYHILYTQPIHASMGSPVSQFPCQASILWELLRLDTR